MGQLVELLHRVWISSWSWMKDNYRIPLVLLCAMLLKRMSDAIGPLKWRFARIFPGNSAPMPPAITSSALCFAASIWRQRTLFQAQLLVACASSIYLAYIFFQLRKHEEKEMGDETELWKSPECAELDKELIDSEIAECQAAHEGPRVRCEVWMWIMVGTALLLNPVYPLHFTRSQWVWVDVLTGVIFLFSLGLSGRFYRAGPADETGNAAAR